ncbi:MAG: hypothetical protein R2817_00305 [Flavobacteriales bacterium]
MNRTLTLLITGCMALPLSAATGGPDAYGYTWIDSNEPGGPVFEWIDISLTGQTVTGLGDDNLVGPFVMATDMPFYWYLRKFVWIGSNGYISFNGNGNMASPFPTIPAATGVNDFIAGLTADLNFAGAGNNGRCYIYDDIQRTIVSYVAVPFWQAAAPSYTGSNTFQIILDKQDSSITVQVLEQNGLTLNNDLLIGIESVAGTIGLQHSADAYPLANYAIRFEMPPTALLEVNDGAANWVGAPGSGGIFRSRNGSPVDLVANGLNTGNTTLQGMLIQGAVLNATGTVLNSFQQSVGNLVPSDDTTVTFASALQPTTAGTFRFRNTVSNVANDLAADNNVRVQEVVIVDTTSVTHDLRFHGTTDDGVGIGWNGGNGGVGVYIIPPYHPARIIATTIRIASNTGNTPFTMKLYADDGPGDSPGTLLDSVYVDGADAVPGDKVIPLSAPLQLASGGVYVQWYMLGPNINIAEDIAPPFSNRTFEVLDGTWAPYRDAEISDFHLGIRLEQLPVYDVSCTGFFGLSDGQTVASSTAVRVWLRNDGNQPLTGFPIRYQQGQGAVISQTFTGTLAIGEEELVTFSTAFVPNSDGEAPLCAWADLDTDLNAANDTVCVDLVTWVGVDELAVRTVELVPNPAIDQVALRGLPAGLLDLLLFDAHGRVVRSLRQQHGGGDLVLALHGLAAGGYQLRLLLNDQYFQSRLTVLP